MKTVFILSASSDIGRFLAEKYLSLGYQVIGTYRDGQALSTLRGHPNCVLLTCDIHRDADLRKMTAVLKKKRMAWDIFISCVGLPGPMNAFFKGDFNQWQDSVEINCMRQLKALHMLYPLRRKRAVVDAAFFAGGGSNSAVVNFSAYTISKIMLTKMCELLDAETPDLNAFIVGPGWTKTKIHQTILKDPHVSRVKRTETKAFLATDTGTPLEDIFECIQWLCAQGKSVAGGRNFSVVHDPWKKGKALAQALRKDRDMYKLRRHKNGVTV